jgi:hypothetical protein
LALDGTGLTTADLLVADICGSGEANAVWEWLYDTLAFNSWILGFDTAPGWSTTVGMPFWVLINPAVAPAGCDWTITGLIPAPFCFNLRPSLNFISVPVYSTSLEMASDLLYDIPFCTAVYKYDCESKSFKAFFAISGGLDDFPLNPGDAVWVNYTGLYMYNYCPPNP